MNGDLERQLGEMGSEYREVVARLRAAREATPRVSRRVPYLAAASLLVLVGLAACFRGLRPHGLPTASQLAYGAREYRASVAEMIATQNPDGSWKNDFLTRRNAAALKGCDSPAARIAHKKALRYLRKKG